MLQPLLSVRKLIRPTRRKGESLEAFCSRADRWTDGHRFELELERIWKESDYLGDLPADERRALVRQYAHALGLSLGEVR